MKAPFKGKFTLNPTPEQITEAVKQDFGGEVRYIWATLGKPIVQDGQKYGYLVAPCKLVDGLKFEQQGAGVLCQTEAETKETYENLCNRSKKHLVSAQWAGGGIVGWASNLRRFVTEIVICP